MKQTNISIFIPHLGCPHRCSFCDQKSISGAAKQPSAEEVSALLEQQAEHLLQRRMTAEIAFFGGSFTAIPHDYMISLMKAAKAAVDKYPAYVGIRCSTRPDCISAALLRELKSFGMTAIELGAQSMSDEVLFANERGHTAADVINAAQLIKQSGIELGLQMMTGLYKDSEQAVFDTAEKFISLKPKTVRIYPTVILSGTRLGELYKSGEYRTFSFDKTVEICAALLRRFEESGISVIRMGLHASEDVERGMLGGVYHPAFREICESFLMLEKIKQLLSGKEKGRYIVWCGAREISKIIGQKRCNIAALAKLGYDISVKADDGMLRIQPSP